MAGGGFMPFQCGLGKFQPRAMPVWFRQFSATVDNKIYYFLSYKRNISRICSGGLDLADCMVVLSVDMISGVAESVFSQYFSQILAGGAVKAQTWMTVLLYCVC